MTLEQFSFDLQLLRKYITLVRIERHCIAAGAIMYDLAIILGENPRDWCSAGILHDIDLEITKCKRNIHTVEAIKILSLNGYSDQIIDAVRLHNEFAHSDRRVSKFHHALAASETLSGMISWGACAFSDKSLQTLSAKQLLSKWFDLTFAPQVDRKIIEECAQFNFELEEFIQVGIVAMKKISTQIQII
jgi:predicted hydrolase (HD superfamily)